MITLTEHLTRIAKIKTPKRTEARRANMLALNARKPWMSEKLCSRCGITPLRHSNRSGVCRECTRNPSKINDIKI
jgi:hypothetical protein